ncbi:hypothetical protein [Amaricoccus solimangrovi]|uniref:Uncharacterized protein n=1 Tax=Amaricoccus solimangrovi TaxID=2589815 RepID=A0A501WLF9_9RHOB|nr:hypothetical protein [Amaricoccus solimangrovi]TPE50188.1 hypothetical protein FJM51_12445 [Amaricoccus solimangrovi]
MKNVSLLAAAAAVFAAPAFAEDFVIKAPGQGMSLHEGPVDMVAYYQPAEDGLLEVTATYAARDGAGEPARLVLGMRDGDGVSFRLPGVPNVTYSFARAGDYVTVRSFEEIRTASAE